MYGYSIYIYMMSKLCSVCSVCVGVSILSGVYRYNPYECVIHEIYHLSVYVISVLHVLHQIDTKSVFINSCMCRYVYHMYI